MSENKQNNFYMKSNSHLPSLAFTLRSQPSPHADIALVAWPAGEEAGGGSGAAPLVLPGHQALLQPHLTALAALCSSCSPHVSMVLLLLLL